MMFKKFREDRYCDGKWFDEHDYYIYHTVKKRYVINDLLREKYPSLKPSVYVKIDVEAQFDSVVCKKVCLKCGKVVDEIKELEKEVIRLADIALERQEKAKELTEKVEQTGHTEWHRDYPPPPPPPEPRIGI